MNWKIRPANENDLKQIEDLHRAIYIEDSVNRRINSIKKIIKEDKRRDNKWAYICDLDSKVIGVGVISEVNFLYGDKHIQKLKDNNFNYKYPSIELTRMLIDSNYQRLGIGTKMSEMLHQVALKINTPIIYRLQTTQNTGSQKIASRMGYKPTGILIAVTNNYYSESKSDLPFHSVIQFMQKEKVEKNFVIQDVYVNETTKPFVELISGINGMQDVSIKISDKNYENIDLKINKWNPGFDFSIVDLGYKKSTLRLEQLTQKGFVPTTILPFYKVQFDNNGNGRYHHALVMQKFNINPRMDLLKIDESNKNLVTIRDYIFNSIE